MSDYETKKPNLAMYDSSAGDLEKNIENHSVEEASIDELNTRDTDIQEKKSQNYFQKFWSWLLELNVETRGVERVPESEQTDTSIMNAGTMWFAANMVVSSVSMGTLGIGIFGLAFWDSVCTIIFFTMLGATTVGYFSTFGPVMGLRQMVISRYSTGMFVSKIFCILNIISCLGWSILNTVVGAQLLHVVGTHHIPIAVACVIIAILTLAVSFCGYKVVHVIEKYSWIPTFIVFLVVIARMKLSHSFTFEKMGSGRAEAGAVLSFGASVYGFATGWTTYAADYTCYMPKTTNKWAIFFAVYVPLCFSLIFTEILGAACMTGTLTNPVFEKNYNENSVGGLLYAVLVPDSVHGFGQFCCVILALSIVANNIPNFYSFALSAQAFDNILVYVPRHLWTIIAAGVAIGVSIPAYYSFSSYMENFMNLIGYWISIYSAIVIPEHLVFRKGFGGYNLDDYNNWRKLPVGIAAFISFATGCAMAAIGMSQVWWTGPAAKGAMGDIGFELVLGACSLSYIISRYFELKIFGR